MEFFNRLRELLSMEEMEDYRETTETLVRILGSFEDEEEENIDPNYVRIADDIAAADGEMPILPAVRDTVIWLYEQGIAENEDDNCMCNLGAFYYSARNGGADYENALKYYTMAADHGNAQAIENLGYCCYYGRGIPVDYEKAYHLFSMGALRNRPVSLYKLGDMYLGGLYVAKDEKLAYDIFERCINMCDDMEDEEATQFMGQVYLRLGKCHEQGLGTEKNLWKAMISYQGAEMQLYKLVSSGEYCYYRSLEEAIEGQERIRRGRMRALREKM